MTNRDDETPEFPDAVLRQFPDIDQTLATWRSILVDGFHGDKNPQTPMTLVTLARLFDIVGMANNLLCRMAGLARTGPRTQRLDTRTTPGARG